MEQSIGHDFTVFLLDPSRALKAVPGILQRYQWTHRTDEPRPRFPV
jgi:hypothetical protein